MAIMIAEEKKMNEKDLVESLKWRYAVKKFDDKKQLSPETWEALEQALLLSASSFGLQPWKFVVVTDKAVKDKLPEHSWGQKQPAECCHLVVICALEEMTEAYIDKYIASIAETRGVTVDSLKGYADMMHGFNKNPMDKNVWMEKQCYIALGTLLTAAATIGVDACPMEGFDAKAYSEILGLKEKGLRPVVVCPLGYRAADDKYAQMAKVRFAASDKIVHI